jgi:hypothetical protein
MFPSVVAVALDERGLPDSDAGEFSLGAPVRFSWIDVMGVPPIEISAYVIDQAGPDDRLVLVDEPTLQIMAVAVELAELAGADSSRFADLITQVVAVAEAPFGRLFDVTDAGGGWSNWDQLRSDSREPIDAAQLVRLARVGAVA